MKPYKKIMIFLSVLLGIATSFNIFLLAQSEFGDAIYIIRDIGEYVFPHSLIAFIPSILTAISSFVLAFVVLALVLVGGILLMIQNDETPNKTMCMVGKVLLIAGVVASLLATTMGYVLEGTFMYILNSIVFPKEYYSSVNLNATALSRLITLSLFNAVMDGAIVLSVIPTLSKKKE